MNAYLNWRSWRSMSYKENSRTKLPSEHGRCQCTLHFNSHCNYCCFGFLHALFIFYLANVVRRSFRRIQKSFNRPHDAQTSAVKKEDEGYLFDNEI